MRKRVRRSRFWRRDVDFLWRFGALGCLVPAVMFLSVSLGLLLAIAR